MYDEIYTPQRQNSLGQMVQRPVDPSPQPGFWTGFGGAAYDAVPSAGLTSASSWSAILDAYGKTQAYSDGGSNLPPTGQLLFGTEPVKPTLKEETIGQIGINPVGAALRQAAKKYAPDPAAVGVAGQVVHGVTSTVTKVGVYSLSGPAAPILFGGDMGINRAQELSDQGVDDATAAKAGTVTAVTSAIGYRLPAALGKTRLQSALIGAVINPAIGAAERGSIHAILQNADYDKIAAQYQPFDLLQLGIDAFTGGAFGALAHGGKGAEGRAATPDEHAAALTMHEVQTRDADMLVKSGDNQAANNAADAQVVARAQLDAGEPVSVAHGLRLDPEMAGQVREAVTTRLKEQLIDDIRAEVKADSSLNKVELRAALDQLDRGEIPKQFAARIAEASELRADVRPDAANPIDKVLAPEKETLARPEAETKTQDTPELQAARETVKADPGRVVALEDGTGAKAADLLEQADEIGKQAEVETKGIKAAIACALRYGT